MPHTSISNVENARRNARVARGNGNRTLSLQEELEYMKVLHLLIILIKRSS